MKVNWLSLNSITRFLWAAVLIALPITSFRYFPFFGEGTLVRPLSLYPLVLLAPILFIRLLRREIPAPWPASLTPLVGFLLVSFAATAIGALYAPLELRGVGYWDRAIRSWITLAVGLLFFACAMWMNHDEDDLEFTLRYLYIGLVLTIFWGGVQWLGYEGIINKRTVIGWQKAFSMRSLINNIRISGLTYEPAWLAGQFSTMYVPWLFASLLAKYRVSRFKWLEAILLVVTMVVLVLTLSRGGMFTIFFVATFILLFLGRRQLRQLRGWFTRPFSRLNGLSNGSRLFGSLMRIVIVVVIIGGMVSAYQFLAGRRYFNRLWKAPTDSLEKYLIGNFTGGRIGYAWGAMAAFVDHPWTGVGMGASGFYIYDNLPDAVLTNVAEIARQISPDSNLFPNPKNLYVRLLSEAGLFGFALFVLFQMAVLADVLRVLSKPGEQARLLGVAGLFTWLAVISYCMTQDSFAMSNLWVNFGILVGMSRQFKETS